MPYKLRDELSFCQVDNHLIFLDIKNDRYFRLPEPLEREFFSFIDDNGQSEMDASALMKLNILTETS